MFFINFQVNGSCAAFSIFIGIFMLTFYWLSIYPI